MMDEPENPADNSPTGLKPLPVEIVSRPAELNAAVREMVDSPAIALDTESNSFQRYPEQLCLIQIASRQIVTQ